MSPHLNRRGFLKASAFTLGSSAALAATSPRVHAQAQAPDKILGTVIDFAAGVPDAQAIKAAGHSGTVRYVSGRRPGTESWMLGKPVTLTETKNNAALGLATASVYQFGKEATADWKSGAAGALIHAPQAIDFHHKAGGPLHRPIYVAIDDNPSREQYTTLIRPYLQQFNVLLAQSNYQLGIYGNYNTIDWAIRDGLGSFFWQHDWGSRGLIHPRVTIHQVADYQRNVGGVIVDVNNVYAKDWGQWLPV
ncbi:DUF1906 domain-containing protein [Corynebacterium sp. sy039]|nr:DUF1906 domain-containing protein [Corynebacterium sp. sy039]